MGVLWTFFKTRISNFIFINHKYKFFCWKFLLTFFFFFLYRLIDKNLANTLRKYEADLIVLEGMGRAIHTNFHASFSCDSLKVAVLKNKWLAQRLGGNLFNVIFKYEMSGKVVSQLSKEKILSETQSWEWAQHTYENLEFNHSIPTRLFSFRSNSSIISDVCCFVCLLVTFFWLQYETLHFSFSPIFPFFFYILLFPLVFISYKVSTLSFHFSISHRFFFFKIWHIKSLKDNVKESILSLLKIFLCVES